MNVLVRDMDLAVPNAHDARRLEILADGLPLFGGTQLLPWLRPDARRNAPVWSWSVLDTVHVSWSSLVKSAADGQRNQGRSFAFWHGPRHVLNRSSLGKELSRRGGCDGQQHWLAVQFGRSLRPSSASEWGVVLMGMFLGRMKW